METSKTYVFNPEGSGNNGGMMSLIAPLLQQRGVDPNVLLAMKGNNGFGNGDGSWFIWLLFILCFCGWGGNGFGFGGRGNGAGLANEINNDYGRSLLMDAIGGNRNALSNLATQLNCTEGQIQQAISALTTQVQNVGNQVGMSGMQTINDGLGAFLDSVVQVTSLSLGLVSHVREATLLTYGYIVDGILQSASLLTHSQLDVSVHSRNIVIYTAAAISEL